MMPIPYMVIMPFDTYFIHIFTFVNVGGVNSTTKGGVSNYSERTTIFSPIEIALDFIQKKSKPPPLVVAL
jgi:hypothetical protein